VLAVAGCAAGSTQPVVATSQPVPPAPSPSPSPHDVNVTASNALARQEAGAWPRSPLGKVWKTGLVIPIGWRPDHRPFRGFSSDEATEAFGNGNLVYTGPPPSGAPTGIISWANGASTKVPVLSEAQVFSALKNNTEGSPRGGHQRQLT
jgi:hypothetical protein